MSGFDDTLAASLVDGDGAASRLPPGDLFAERYRVQQILGHGGMGAVYRVHDERLDEIVALKLLTLNGDEAKQRFLDEVRLARRVTHPNVARTHDFGEQEGQFFLTMEFVDGMALDQLADESGPFPPARVAEFGAAIADGLRAAHDVGIVHRDLKPANVMVAGSRVVITDFGLARTASAASPLVTQSIAGTPMYMAPEQVAGEALDARADIYALGAMLYELATHHVPFAGDSPISVAAARLRQDPPDPRHRVAIPDELAMLILRCMALAPEDRPASAEAVRVALLPFCSPETSRSASARAPSSVGPFAPLAAPGTTVAVLPFVFRGPPDHSYLGEALAEELIDALSRTKGLRVLSLGSTLRFATDRDPVAVGRALGANVIVDGAVQLAGPKVRLSARLVSAEHGEQRWSDRFEGGFEDVLSLQESMGRRVAESLRVELSASAPEHAMTPEATELYLRARRLLRSDVMTDASSLIEMLERSLALAPGHPAALSALAIASVRAWWGHATDDARRREEGARRALKEAVQRAPELAETHLARAMLAVQEGAFREGARALTRALELAPTMADAHQYLGELQVEGGRVSEGIRRLEFAVELDRSLSIAHISLARVARLREDLETHDRHRALLDQLFPTPTLPVLNSRFRWAMYDRDETAQRDLLSQIEAVNSGPAQRMATLFAVGLGQGPVADVARIIASTSTWATNVRFTSYMDQVAAEVYGARGAQEDCLLTIDTASRRGLVDLLWLDRCPLLEAVRSEARFIEARRRVKQRASEMWRR